MKKIFVVSLSVLVFLAVTSAAKADGPGDFATKCAACHGTDGKGRAAMAGAFKVDPAALDITDADAAKCAGMVKNGGGAMKPVAGLDDAAIQAICAHVNML